MLQLLFSIHFFCIKEESYGKLVCILELIYVRIIEFFVQICDCSDSFPTF